MLLSLKFMLSLLLLSLVLVLLALLLLLSLVLLLLSLLLLLGGDQGLLLLHIHHLLSQHDQLALFDPLPLQQDS